MKQKGSCVGERPPYSGTLDPEILWLMLHSLVAIYSMRLGSALTFAWTPVGGSTLVHVRKGISTDVLVLAYICWVL